MTGTQIVLLIALVALAALCFALLSLARRFLLDLKDERSGVDPILGARDRVAIYRAGGISIPHHPKVAIPMPDHLKSEQQMVDWLAKDLPKLVEEAARSRS